MCKVRVCNVRWGTSGQMGRGKSKRAAANDVALSYLRLFLRCCRRLLRCELLRDGKILPGRASATKPHYGLQTTAALTGLGENFDFARIRFPYR